MNFSKNRCILFCYVVLCYITGNILCYSVPVAPQVHDRIPSEGIGDYYSSTSLIIVHKVVRQVGGWCVIPSPPDNGSQRPGNRCSPEDTTPHCKMTPGAFVPPDWIIKYSCDAGYKLNSTRKIAVCSNGRWLPWLATCEKEPAFKPCERSETVVYGSTGQLTSCRGDVVFEETFDEPLGDKWAHVVTIGDTPDDLFNVFRADPANSFVSQGKLVIKPTVFDDAFVTGGTLDLIGCTAPAESWQWLCKRRGFPFSILPPVASARVHTRDSFTFRYGVIEIRAKMPQGDWLVPELWLEPKDHSYGPGLLSGRVRIALTRGNSELRCEGEDLGRTLLESGVLLGAEETIKRRTVRTRLPNNWHSQFHNYTLVWKPGSISFQIDGELEKELIYEGGRLCDGQVEVDGCYNWKNGSNIAPIDKDFYILLGVSTGNERDFPDECVSRGKPKPWRNLELSSKLQFWQDRETWHSSWTTEGSSLIVEHIRVTAI